MRRAFLVPAAAAVFAAFAFACCKSAQVDPPSYFAEEPAGSSKWVAVQGEPAWVTRPTASEGCLAFVADSQSNLRSIAAGGTRPSAERQATTRVREILTPVVGADEASLAAAAVPKCVRLVRRACKEELVGRSEVPGSGLCTAWALWEVPVDPVVGTLPEEKREWARAALLSAR